MEYWNLEPQLANETLVDGEGGSYAAWAATASMSPWLSSAKLGAGRLVLKPLGFALPHYSDSSKIGLVLQGTCTIGMVYANGTEEQVLTAKEGDSFPVPAGSVSWWFNGGDSDTAIVFLGNTAKAHVPGKFTYFLLAGVLSVLKSFPPDLISTSFDLSKDESEELTDSQTGALIITLGEGVTRSLIPNDGSINGDQPQKDEIMFRFGSASPDVEVKSGGTIAEMTEKELPLLAGVGLSARLVRLEPNAVLGPRYERSSAEELTYVKSGGGRIRIAGSKGMAVLDAEIKEGQLFHVPRFFTSAITAEDHGLELFSVFTSSKPEFGELAAGKKSIWKALSSAVVEAAHNVEPGFVENLKAKVEKETIIAPPSKN